MHRMPQNKQKSKKQFNHRSSKTARVNLSLPLRGGIRL